MRVNARAAFFAAVISAMPILFYSPVYSQQYTITQLDPSHPGIYNYSNGEYINESGVVLGRGSGQFTTDIMTIWLPRQTVGTPIHYFGFNRTTPEGLNDSGDIAGYGPDNSSQPHGFFNNTDLGVGYVNDVNNLGQVAGWTFDSLYIWQNGVFDYQPTSYWGSEILAINDSGVGAGYWYTDCTADCLSEVCIFRGDSITLLGYMGGGSYAEANDINNVGQLAGWYCSDADCIQYRGFIWTDGDVVTIPTLGGSGSEAKAINDAGVAVGQAYDAGNQQRAIIFDPVNGLRDLNGLIPGGTGWELITAHDINNKGQIAGVGRIGGLIRGFLLSPPDTSIEIVAPELDQLFIAGETDTIKWYAENIETVKISVILHYYDLFEQVEIPIADSVPAEDEKYVWEIPDSLLSRQCRIVIQDADNPDEADTSSDFRIKGYVLTRITDDGEYEAFRPDVHGWSVANTSFEMWPSDWWGQFSYSSGIDPYTNAVYPSFFKTELRAESWDFIDWPLFVRTFGIDNCYTTAMPTGAPEHYWPSATSFWALNSTEHSGSCVGLSATSILAFGNKDLLLQKFPEFGAFDNLYAAPFTDARREVVNQLMFTQYAKIPKLNEDTTLRNPNNTWLERVKSTFMDDDRSRDFFLGFYNSRGGGHAVTPYRLVKDSVEGISGETYLLYVYDNNHPGDSTRAFVIRPSDGFWRYPATGPGPWLAYGTGMILEPFSLYLQDAIFPEAAPHKTSSESVAQRDGDFQQVYGFRDASVVIRRIEDFANDSVGFIDTAIFNTVLYAEPITAKTGYFSRPIGYRLEQGEYDISISNFTDSVSNFFVFRDESIFGFVRNDANPSDTDNFYISNYVNFWNNDTTDKSLNMFAVIIEPTRELVYAIQNFDLNSTDSSHMQANDALLYLPNFGAEEYYDLSLRVSSGSGGSEVTVKNIRLEANAGHVIWPDWNDLSQPIKIQIDYDNDGPVDDSFFVNGFPTDITDPPNSVLPADFVLHQNYPNPFNLNTTIGYSLRTRANVTLEIFNQLGQKVRTLVNETKSAGNYTVDWDGTNDLGQVVTTGVYLYRLTAGDFVQSKKMVLLK